MPFYFLDIDECKLYGSPCSHECINVPGSFKCSCPDGFLLLNNGRCKGNELIYLINVLFVTKKKIYIF